MNRNGDGVPAELMDRSHVTWQSDAAAAGWAARVGLVLNTAPGPLTRHRAALEAWAVTEGYAKYYGDNTWPFVDLKKIRELGIPAAASAAEMYERHPELAGALSAERY